MKIHYTKRNTSVGFEVLVDGWLSWLPCFTLDGAICMIKGKQYVAKSTHLVSNHTNVMP